MVHDSHGVDADPLQRWPVGHRREDDVARIFEMNHAVEQVMDARRQQKSILAIESLLVRRAFDRRV